MRLELVDLADVIDRARPRLERNLVHVQAARQRRDAGAPAADRLPGNGPHDRLAVGPAWRRQRRRRRRTAAGAATTAAAAASLTTARWCLGAPSTSGWRLSSWRVTARRCLGTDAAPGQGDSHPNDRCCREHADKPESHCRILPDV